MRSSSSARAAELSVDQGVRYSGAAAAVLAPVAGCVAVLYVILAVTHPLVISGSAGTVMSIVAGISAVGLGVLTLVGYLRPPGLQFANPLLALIVLIVIVNSCLHMVITHDPRQTTNLMLAVIAAGIAILPTNWNVAVTLVAWLGWIIGMSASEGGDLVHWLFAMAMATLVGQLARYGRRSSLDKAAESVSRVAELSVQDPLTGLANRRGLGVLGEEMIAIATGAGAPVTVVFVDVDGLKEVNDRHGHDAGDDVLRAVAHALRIAFRTTDVIARWGGDEFVVVVLGEAGSPSELEGRITHTLALERMVSTEIWSPAVSVGSSTQQPDSASGFEKLLSAADADMYSRRRGRRAPKL